LGDPKLAVAASRALRAYVVPHLRIVILRRSAPTERVWAARSLGRIGKLATPAKAALEHVAVEASDDLLLAVLAAHWEIARDARFVRTHYETLLSADDPRVRIGTLRLLGRLGPTASFAVGRLERTAREEGQPRDIRRAAELALESIRSG